MEKNREKNFSASSDDENSKGQMKPDDFGDTRVIPNPLSADEDQMLEKMLSSKKKHVFLRVKGIKQRTSCKAYIIPACQTFRRSKDTGKCSAKRNKEYVRIFFGRIGTFRTGKVDGWGYEIKKENYEQQKFNKKCAEEKKEAHFR